MHHLDDVQLYDLSEAGRVLYRDPVWLARQARHRKIPSAHGPRGMGLPAAWVEAASGKRAQDPEALRVKWLARLAPPSPDAHRAARPREHLPVEALLSPNEAARALCASPAALQRMDEDGVLPSVRIDGQRRYDERLVSMLARAANGEDFDAIELDERRFQLRAWSRFEYRTTDTVPDTDTDMDTDTAPAPGPRIIRAEGFETIDDDED